MAHRVAHNWIQDFRQGIRSIKRTKGLAVGVIISMGLGLGATASMFSVVDFFVFRPLPVPETNRVVRIASSTPDRSEVFFFLSRISGRCRRQPKLHRHRNATYETPLIGFAPNLTDQPRVSGSLPDRRIA